MTAITLRLNVVPWLSGLLVGLPSGAAHAEAGDLRVTSTLTGVVLSEFTDGLVANAVTVGVVIAYFAVAWVFLRQPDRAVARPSRVRVRARR